MTDAAHPDRNEQQLRGILAAAVSPGSEARRWAARLARSLRVAVGVGLLVIGTGLAGKGIALCLHGLGLIDSNLPGPAHEALAAGLGMAMIGSATIGLAVEAAFRSPSFRADAAPWETLLSMVPALPVTLWALERIESIAARLLPQFSEILRLVPDYLNEVGNRGLVAGLIGLPLMWLALQYGAPRYPFIGENSPALLYTCWMTLVIVGYQV